MNGLTVFICGRKPGKKIQLEIPEHILEEYKKRAKEFQNGRYTPKQIMENILINNIDGVVASE